MKYPTTLKTREARSIWRKLHVFCTSEVEIIIITSALEALQRLREAQSILERDGLLVHDSRGNPRSHPMLLIERDNRVIFLKSMRELSIDTEIETDEDREFAAL